MPIYEYRCRKCGKRLEYLLKRSTEQPVCSCGSRDLERLISSFAVAQDSGSEPSCPGGTCGFDSSCGSGACGL
ncbi:zinc ribbon domain-containing protein [bacterium]|nr:zinc ribbon domain-containing protein [bacterium]